MRLGIDVGVHAQAQRGHEAAARRLGGDAPHLLLALRVEVGDAVVEAQGDLGLGLPHPREDDVAATEPRAPRLEQLEPGDHVDPGPQAPQDLEQAPAGVGLHRVVDAVGHGGKGLVIGPVGVLDCGPAVDVERGAEGPRGVLQGDAVAPELSRGPARIRRPCTRHATIRSGAPMKDVVTAEDVTAVPPGGEVHAGPGAIVTPWAREIAATRGRPHRPRSGPPAAPSRSPWAPTTAGSR